MSNKIIAEGAEARISFFILNKQKYILKERISKTYRVKELDDIILLRRLKSEVKILNLVKLANVCCPIVYYSDGNKILMEYLPFCESKSIVNGKPNILKKIAQDIVKLHRNNIIHGDLTLCNILFDKKNNVPYFIDFGLSFISTKTEDKAMDLEVLREIIIADFSEKIWKVFEKEYAKYNPEIIKHMEKIQKRKKYLS